MVELQTVNFTAAGANAGSHHSHCFSYIRLFLLLLFFFTSLWHFFFLYADFIVVFLAPEFG